MRFVFRGRIDGWRPREEGIRPGERAASAREGEGPGPGRGEGPGPGRGEGPGPGRGKAPAPGGGEPQPGRAQWERPLFSGDNDDESDGILPLIEPVRPASNSHDWKLQSQVQGLIQDLRLTPCVDTNFQVEPCKIRNILCSIAPSVCVRVRACDVCVCEATPHLGFQDAQLISAKTTLFSVGVCVCVSVCACVCVGMLARIPISTGATL